MSRPLILSLCLLSLACRGTDKSEEGTTIDSGDSTDSADSANPNSPPVIEAVEFTPNPVRTDDVLTANITTTDADEDTIGYTFVWFVDGLVIDDRGAELDGTESFDKGDTITVSVTPNDGTEDGAPLSAEPIVVSNTPPDAPEISLVDDGDLLGSIEIESTDADGDEVSYDFSWSVDGTDFTDTLTTTETDDTVPYADTDGAQTWTLTVTPFDGEEEGEPATASLVLDARSCAFQFDSDDAIMWMPASGFGIEQQDFTVEFWIDPGTELGDWGTVFRTSEGSSQVMRISVDTSDSSVMEIDTVLSQSNNYCEEPNDGSDALVPRDGDWHHFAVVRSGSVLTTYLDGVLQSTGDLTWSGCSCGPTSTPCLAENGDGLFGQTAPTGVAIGPMRFARGAAYTEDFEPAFDWALDGDSIAQWNTQQCFDGTSLPDAAGGNNNGSNPSGISAVQGP